MNKEFKAKSERAVLIFSFLSKEADKRGKKLVFIGGSAIQQALKSPKRFSVDLDLVYDGEADELVKSLETEGYAVTQSRTVNPLFSFYKAGRDDTVVKVQFMNETGVPSQETRLVVGGKSFVGLVARLDYLMAAKLATLAFGTIGRKKEKELGLIKDVFDFNCLADEFGVPDSVWSGVPSIVSAQNKLWGKSYGVDDVYDSIEKTLSRAAQIGSNEGLVSLGTLGNFDQFLPEGHVKKYGFVEMVYRVLALVRIVRKSVGKSPAVGISVLEKECSGRFRDAVFVGRCESMLLEKGFSFVELHDLKIFAPKALIYLYAATFPDDYGPNPRSGKR